MRGLLDLPLEAAVCHAGDALRIAVSTNWTRIASHIDVFAVAGKVASLTQAFCSVSCATITDKKIQLSCEQQRWGT